ncbi:MAG TPA: VCBS repeat-containing protein [Micromonosporaceae bacterium]|nr:VCBS repeat-containing protein [Micromonosporaceae bacterium]
MGTMVNASGRTTSLRGDGRSDIVARNYYTGQLLAFPHRGLLAGLDTYEAPVTVSDAFGPRSVEWLSVGDFTGDGRADILVVTVGDGCRLHRNTSDLARLTTTILAVDTGCDISHAAYHSILLADVTGDGRVDIVGRRAGTGTVEVLLNGYADGVFAFSAPRPLATLRNTDYIVGMADVTLNGRLDLVVSRAGGQLAVFEFAPGGEDAAAFPAGAGQWYPVVDVAGGVRVVAVSDVDGDGRPDLLGIRADGALIAYPHSGVFWPHEPLATFLPPVVVGLGWGEFDLIN